MNSIERVKAALTFSGPDRIPVWKILGGDVFVLAMIPSKKWRPGHGEGEEGLFPHPGDDLAIKLRAWRWKKPEWAKTNPNYKGIKWLKVKREEIDFWGAIWNRTGEGTSMGHPGRPSLTDWSKLDDYLARYTPDPDDKSQYTLFVLLRKLVGRKYRLGLLGHQGPFQTVQNIRGFKNLMLDHRKHPTELKRLLAHLTEWYIQVMDGWIKYGGKPHGFYIVDDLGSQLGPFISPRLFKEFYEPAHGAICKAAHDRGCDIFHHSCGKVDQLLPHLIDWGMDAFEFDSPRMNNYADLKPFRGKVMFWGCVNIQSIYTRHGPEDNEREVWHMMRNLGTPDGGFGAFFYPSPNHIQVPKENIKAFKRGIRKYGTYSKIPPHWWEHPTVEEWDKDNVPPLPPLKPQLIEK